MNPRHGTAPIVIEETPGKKAYCQCGLSAILPYCDGSHARESTGVIPIVCQVDAAGKKAVCQCHLPATLPYCDGSHARDSSGLTPMVCQVDDAGKTAVCQCRRSSQPTNSPTWRTCRPSSTQGRSLPTSLPVRPTMSPAM